MEAFNAPEVAVDEERKLREERERREEDLASKAGREVEDAKEVVLEEGKYAQVRVVVEGLAPVGVGHCGGWPLWGLAPVGVGPCGGRTRGHRLV